MLHIHFPSLVSMFLLDNLVGQVLGPHMIFLFHMVYMRYFLFLLRSILLDIAYILYLIQFPYRFLLDINLLLDLLLLSYSMILLGIIDSVLFLLQCMTLLYNFVVHCPLCLGNRILMDMVYILLLLLLLYILHLDIPYNLFVLLRMCSILADILSAILLSMGNMILLDMLYMFHFLPTNILLLNMQWVLSPRLCIQILLDMLYTMLLLPLMNMFLFHKMYSLHHLWILLHLLFLLDMVLLHFVHHKNIPVDIPHTHYHILCNSILLHIVLLHLLYFVLSPLLFLSSFLL
mmetsp:Transcript_12798/g.19273  ORF Transcript_12798/g.19273 Transcript_12798/m.19273 type:complete len:289 (-) Transcript_12798:386-1252(-)